MTRDADGGATDRLVEAPIEIDSLVAATENAASGALVVFAGTVREDAGKRAVRGITYTAQRALAGRVLGELEDEALRRDGIVACRVVHRVGFVPLGEASVAVVVRGAHRAEAFAACRGVIDGLKKRAPIWKEEHFADGGRARPEGRPLRDGSRDERSTDHS